MNLLSLMWLSYTVIISVSGVNFLYFECLPNFLRQLYAFGKVHKTQKQHGNIFKKIEVPKRWFSHFYMFASIYIPAITACVCLKYFGICSCSILNRSLDMFASPHRYAGYVWPESVIIAGILLSLQVIRRCYECFFISSYSDSKMNILHYIVGMTFYFGVGLSFIHDAPGFQSDGDYALKVYVSGKWLLWRHIIGTLLFFAGFLLQFQTNKAFAALRKRDDKVVSLDHFMPNGGGFEYVSCPHYFAEIVIYFSVSIILGGESTMWWLVCLWTFVNQTLTGLTSHQWYRQKYKKNYPQDRKAIIPFLL